RTNCPGWAGMTDYPFWVVCAVTGTVPELNLSSSIRLATAAKRAAANNKHQAIVLIIQSFNHTKGNKEYAIAAPDATTAWFTVLCPNVSPGHRGSIMGSDPVRQIFKYLSLNVQRALIPRA